PTKIQISDFYNYKFIIFIIIASETEPETPMKYRNAAAGVRMPQTKLAQYPRQFQPAQRDGGSRNGIMLQPGSCGIKYLPVFPYVSSADSRQRKSILPLQDISREGTVPPDMLTGFQTRIAYDEDQKQPRTAHCHDVRPVLHHRIR